MEGDFNLMRRAQDKNNDRVNWARLELFNDHIGDGALGKYLAQGQDIPGRTNSLIRSLCARQNFHDTGAGATVPVLLAGCGD
jgi:hypothetical protein